MSFESLSKLLFAAACVERAALSGSVAITLLAVVLGVPSCVSGAEFRAYVTDVTATQAALYIEGADGPCSLDLHEGHQNGPPHPDATASVDTAREDTIVWKDGTRVITLGHQRSNLALAADTQYEIQVSSCGSASVTFRTIAPRSGRPRPMVRRSDHRRKAKARQQTRRLLVEFKE
jgi:hypothetical protein